MKVFLDSSSFAKRFVNESGSEKVDEICMQASTLGLSILCFPEIISALNRKRREKTLSPFEYGLAKNRLLEDIEDADIIQVIPQIISRSTTLLEVSALRALDALQVACAIEWEADLFVSSDKRQIRAARAAKLNCQYV